MTRQTTLSAAGLALAPALLLVACDREKATAPPPVADSAAVVAARPPAPWFICDALNKPTVLVASKPDANGETTILSLDRSDYRPPTARRYTVGAATAENGAQLQSLSREGAAVGHVRTLDPAGFERPQDATTAPVVEVKLDADVLSCRWLLRTRLFGVAAGRTVLVTDEDNGPLLRTFDFKASVGGRVLPDGVQRSSQPTIRFEAGKLEDEAYVFANEGYGYTVDAGGVSITQDGQATTSEPFIALQRAVQ